MTESQINDQAYASVNCGNGKNSSQPLAFDSSYQNNANPPISYYVSKGFVQCFYNDTDLGLFFINITPTAKNAVSGKGMGFNITVSETCSGMLTNDQSAENTVSIEVKSDVMKTFIDYMRSFGYLTNLTLFLIFWLIIGGVAGAALAETTGNAEGYLYGFGIIGFFDIIFYTFIYPLLGGFILFSGILVVIVVLSVRAKNRVIGDGR